MFSLIMMHPKFESQAERLIPSHDLRDLIAAVKQKVRAITPRASDLLVVHTNSKTSTVISGGE